MSWTVRQLRWALRERAAASSSQAWAEWDDEVRYIAGLLIAGGNYDDTSDVE